MKELEKKAAEAIFEAIANGGDNEGEYSAEVEDGDNIVCFNGVYGIDGYYENDYVDGTGAWVTTSATVCIVNAIAYNEEGDPVDVDCDLSEIERLTEKEIAA